MVRTPGFHPGNAGSIPAGVAIYPFDKWSEVCFDGSIAQWQRQCTQNAQSVCSNQTGATILYNFNLAQYSAKDAGRSVKPLPLAGLEHYQDVPPRVDSSVGRAQD